MESGDCTATSTPPALLAWQVAPGADGLDLLQRVLRLLCQQLRDHLGQVVVEAEALGVGLHEVGLGGLDRAHGGQAQRYLTAELRVVTTEVSRFSGKGMMP